MSKILKTECILGFPTFVPITSWKVLGRPMSPDALRQQLLKLRLGFSAADVQVESVENVAGWIRLDMFLGAKIIGVDVCMCIYIYSYLYTYIYYNLYIYIHVKCYT